LAKAGVIFCSISEAIREHPDLVRKYLGSVVPPSDNFYATLNSAVFSDGSFVYIPPGTRCPMELSTYFRINAENTGQFERTLIIADKGAFVSYLEGCTAPKRDVAQLHAAVVEIVAEEDAEVKYSTVQNWYPGDAEGRGGILNYVTKRADCRGDRSKVMWTQVETGSAITWKYPSCILRGDDSQGEFYSIAIANNHQQADTGTKMIHLGKRTKSRIVSKGISAGQAQNTYRGQVSMHPKASDSRNYTQCDSLLIGDRCGAHTVPYIEVRNASSRVEHEATTSKVDDDQLFYCRSRGVGEEEAVALVVNGFCKEVLRSCPWSSWSRRRPSSPSRSRGASDDLVPPQGPRLRRHARLLAGLARRRAVHPGPARAGPSSAEGEPGVWHVLGFLLLSLPLTAWFVGFTRARTDGDWGWRWGGDKAPHEGRHP
jgi:Fe-S cluster assembly protein SufB